MRADFQLGQQDRRVVVGIDDLAERVTSLLLPAIDLPAAGQAIAVNWAPVPGASRAVVASATVQVGSAALTQSLGILSSRAAGNGFEISIPQSKRITSLNLKGLQYKDDGGTWVDVTGAAQLGDGARLLVSMPNPAGGWLVLYAVPAVGPRGAIPALFTGASFSNRTLTLPGTMAASRLRLTLVKNAAPQDFQEREMRLGEVTGWAKILPKNLQLLDPEGTAIWAFANEFPLDAPVAEIDLTAPLTIALEQRLKANQSPSVTFLLKGDTPSRVRFGTSAIQGALVREFPGVTTVALRGESHPLPLDPKRLKTSLAAEVPGLAIADLTLHYEGIRLLETVADDMPSASEAIAGVVVAADPVVRSLPPAVLHPSTAPTLAPVKVGLIGRAPVACEISVSLVDMSSGSPGIVLARPGVRQLGASRDLALVWVDLPWLDDPTLPAPTVPVGISVRANQGRFFWVQRPVPLVKLAVRDAQPGNRPLLLNGQRLLNIAKTDQHLPGFSWPVAAFAQQPPRFSSHLFLTLDVSDLVLRYPR
ncbi:hypothetical protein [Nodosilinea sp. E11]|uniref:hypothetical protein n=1 Tax=Nodosilinea sp. E11 TaxID=3037479 RepID=UPI0029348BAF|nr:hypothetical protein [Nodosilinea sp. E11]WOD39728.1 hypothetical protein RRF56_02825 [Nodosilinea sp. E11]